MEKLPIEIQMFVFSFLTIPERINIRRVCMEWRSSVNKEIVEVDREIYIPITKFSTNHLQYYIKLIQKRNVSIGWTDHRGFFIVDSYDAVQWNYYDSLRRRLFGESSPTEPMYAGKIFFYDF